MQLSPDFLVLYPTDTLYGLGVDATDPHMVERLQALKGREAGKAISIAVASYEMLEQYAEATPLARRLAEKFFPGKLTLVLTSKPGLAPGLVAADGSIGIRIPDHDQALELIREAGKPITATSANVSGLPPEDTPAEILEQFGNKASWITEVIDAGPLPPSAASTVVDARGTDPLVIREGAISIETINSALD